jgi:hypothetical protein
MEYCLLCKDSSVYCERASGCLTFIVSMQRTCTQSEPFLYNESEDPAVGREDPWSSSCVLDQKLCFKIKFCMHRALRDVLTVPNMPLYSLGVHISAVLAQVFRDCSQTFKDVKVKLSLYLTKHHAMKTYGGVDIYFHFGTRWR